MNNLRMLIQLTLLQFYELLFIFLISLFHMDKITFEKSGFSLKIHAMYKLRKKRHIKTRFSHPSKKCTKVRFLNVWTIRWCSQSPFTMASLKSQPKSLRKDAKTSIPSLNCKN